MKINLNVPSYVKKALALLVDNGYEAYIVGGAIRDYFLNKEAHDFDITTNASVFTMLEIFKDYKVIQTGIKHNTITLHIEHEDVEITSFRGNNIKEDIENRDFTINTLLVDIHNEVYDCKNAIEDIHNKVIRMVNKEAFNQDPLRVLRAIRLSGQHHFMIEEATNTLLLDSITMLDRVAKERIASELNKILVSDDIERILIEYKRVFFHLIPELEKSDGFEQHNIYHVYDVYTHIVKVVANCIQDEVTRLAALFHDIGKPMCYFKDDKGVGHFYGHGEPSAYIAKQFMQTYRYSNKQIESVFRMIYYHDLRFSCDERQIKRFLYKFNDNENIDRMFSLKRGDIIGQNPIFINRLEELDRSYELTKKIISEGAYLSVKDLDVNGNDLVNLGIEKKLRKVLLAKALDACVEGKIENRFDEIMNFIAIENEKLKGN